MRKGIEDLEMGWTDGEGEGAGWGPKGWEELIYVLYYPVSLLPTLL